VTFNALQTGNSALNSFRTSQRTLHAWGKTAVYDRNVCERVFIVE